MPFAYRPMLKLSDLETTRDFFGGDAGQVMLAYQTALLRGTDVDQPRNLAKSVTVE